ncbi:MAG: copper chaperone PCu(A)C [Gemmatimonadota bacterium]
MTSQPSLKTSGILGALVLVLALAACAEREPPDPPQPVQVRDAWSRPAAIGTTGVAYITLENTDTADVHLTRVISTVATRAELHETMDSQGMSHMEPRPDVLVAHGATIAMRPGGLHIMLVELTRALAVGDTVPLSLRFADGRAVRALAIVRAN